MVRSGRCTVWPPGGQTCLGRHNARRLREASWRKTLLAKVDRLEPTMKMSPCSGPQVPCGPSNRKKKKKKTSKKKSFASTRNAEIFDKKKFFYRGLDLKKKKKKKKKKLSGLLINAHVTGSDSWPTSSRWGLGGPVGPRERDRAGDPSRPPKEFPFLFFLFFFFPLFFLFSLFFPFFPPFFPLFL